MKQQVTPFGVKYKRMVFVAVLIVTLVALGGCAAQGTSSNKSKPVQVVSSYNVAYANGDSTSTTFDRDDHGDILKNTTVQKIDGKEIVSTDTHTYTPDGCAQTLTQDSPDMKFSCNIASTVTGTSNEDQTVTYDYVDFDDKGSEHVPIAANSTAQYSPTSLWKYELTNVFKAEGGTGDITFTFSYIYGGDRINHYWRTQGQGDAAETLMTIDYAYGDNDTVTITLTDGEDMSTAVVNASLTYEDGYLTKVDATRDGEHLLTATFEYETIENPNDFVRKAALLDAFSYLNDALT